MVAWLVGSARRVRVPLICWARSLARRWEKEASRRARRALVRGRPLWWRVRVPLVPSLEKVKWRWPVASGAGKASLRVAAMSSAKMRPRPMARRWGRRRPEKWGSRVMFPEGRRWALRRMGLSSLRKRAKSTESCSCWMRR